MNVFSIVYYTHKDIVHDLHDGFSESQVRHIPVDDSEAEVPRVILDASQRRYYATYYNLPRGCVSGV